MKKTEVDFGNLLRTFLPKKSRCISYFAVAPFLVVSGIFCAYRAGVAPDNPGIAVANTIACYMAAGLLIASAVFLVVYNILVWKNSRLEFYEKGIFYNSALGAHTIPSEAVLRIQQVISIYGTYYYLYLSQGKVLFSSAYFGPEIKEPLYAAFSESEKA